jgi:hypothetical protein
MKKLSTLTTLVLALLLTQVVKGVPLLNSYPSAQSTIFLDFDGQYVNSGVWNGGTPFTCAPAALSDVQITEVFNRVAEDYRPFNINITTDAAIFAAAPYDKRIRIIITPTSAWYPGVGGVAWVSSFLWGDDTPGFVFCDRLGPNNPKLVAECCSHESGHTLGLSHQSKYDGADCTNPAELYNSGIGYGQASWAPLMGNGYGRNMTNWNNGPTQYGCTNVQDNLSIISSQNGFSYRLDDYSDLPNASANALTENNFNISGVISTNTDKDVFKLTVSQNTVYHITAAPFSIAANNEGANLDIKLDVYNASGVLVNSYNPADKMDVSIDSSFTAGTYYFMIDGTGNTNIGEYGSLGGYTISGTSGTLPVKDVYLSGSAVDGRYDLKWNIISDDPIKTIILETSEDGWHFATAIDIPVLQSGYSAKPVAAGVIYYRLKVVSAVGQIVYSNIISFKSPGQQDNIFSVPTLIQQEIKVTSSLPYQYQLYTINGHVIAAGKATAGVNYLSMTNKPSGVYMLKMVSNNTVKTERIIKQ